MTERSTDDGRLTADTELLARYARTGDEAAFAALVRRHLDGVYSAALRRVGGDTHLAEDVAQRVFVAFARKAAGVATHPVVTSWLYAVTRNEAANLVRTERRRRAREQEAVIMHENNPEADADWSRVAPVLDEVVDELSESDRAAILLRFVDRRPFADIGATLRVSEDAARMRVERALEKLRVLLGRRGVTSTAAALGTVLGSHAVVAAPAGLASVVTGVALTGGTAAAGVLTIMSTGKIAATLIAVGGLVGIGFGVYGIRQRDRAEAARLAAAEERDAYRASLQRVEARAAEAEARARDSEAKLVAQASIPARPTSAAAKPVAADDAAAALLKEKLERSDADKRALNAVRATNTDMQRLMLESERATFGLRFGPLYRRLRLTPEQASEFERRLGASSENLFDLMSASLAKGLSPADSAVQKLAQQERERFTADLQALLGPAGFQAYQDYDRSYSAREALGPLVVNLLTSDTPLSGPQLDELTEIVAHQSTTYQQGGKVRGGATDVNWGNVLAEAPRVLAPPQVDALKALTAQAGAAQKMRGITDALARPTTGSTPSK